MVKVGSQVDAQYNNGEIVIGEVVLVRQFGERVLLTVKCQQGYRAIYTDKCDRLDILNEVEV